MDWLNNRKSGDLHTCLMPFLVDSTSIERLDPLSALYFITSADSGFFALPISKYK